MAAATTDAPEKKQTVAEKIELAQKEIQQKCEDLTNDPDWQTKWAEYLDLVAQMPRYSFRNLMMIWSQNPSASLCQGYRSWESMGRNVKKGEKALKILGPVKKLREPDDPGYRPDKPTYKIVGFKLVNTFDVSQTEGLPLAEPPRPTLLEGEAPEGLWDVLSEHITADGWTVERGDTGEANGWTSPADRVIRVGDDLDDRQAVKTLAHEIGHARLHADDPEGTDLHRGIKEVEAESVAYSVMKACGVPSDMYSVPYVAGWAKGDAQVVQDTAERVRTAATQIVTAVYERLPELDRVSQIVDEARQRHQIDEAAMAR